MLWTLLWKWQFHRRFDLLLPFPLPFPLRTKGDTGGKQSAKIRDRVGSVRRNYAWYGWFIGWYANSFSALKPPPRPWRRKSLDNGRSGCSRINLARVHSHGLFLEAGGGDGTDYSNSDSGDDDSDDGNAKGDVQERTRWNGPKPGSTGTKIR